MFKDTRLRRTEPGLRISTAEATGKEGFAKEGRTTSKRQPLGPATGSSRHREMSLAGG